MEKRDLVWVFQKIAGEICEDSAFHVHHDAKSQKISLYELYESSRSGRRMNCRAADTAGAEDEVVYDQAAEADAAEAEAAEAEATDALEAVDALEALKAAETALKATEAAEAEVEATNSAVVEAEAEADADADADAQVANEVEFLRFHATHFPQSTCTSLSAPMPQRLIRGHMDIYGQILNRDAHEPITCIHCGLRVGVNRYAPHLDKCMVGNRRGFGFNRNNVNRSSSDGSEDSGGIDVVPVSSSVSGIYRVTGSPPPIIPLGGQLRYRSSNHNANTP